MLSVSNVKGVVTLFSKTNFMHATGSVVPYDPLRTIFPWFFSSK